MESDSIETGIPISYFGRPMEESRLSGKDNNAGKRWRQQEKRGTKSKMDWFPKGSPRLEFARANQGCSGQAHLATAHSQRLPWIGGNLTAHNSKLDQVQWSFLLSAKHLYSSNCSFWRLIRREKEKTLMLSPFLMWGIYVEKALKERLIAHKDTNNPSDASTFKKAPSAIKEQLPLVKVWHSVGGI